MHYKCVSPMSLLNQHKTHYKRHRNSLIYRSNSFSIFDNHGYLILSATLSLQYTGFPDDSPPRYRYDDNKTGAIFFSEANEPGVCGANNIGGECCGHRTDYSEESTQKEGIIFSNQLRKYIIVWMLCWPVPQLASRSQHSHLKV